jgi:hypothetical protein
VLAAVGGAEENCDEREQINRHILAVFDTCAAMNASQLRFIFDALDVDPKNGFLSRKEAETLCEHILGEAGTEAVVERWTTTRLMRSRLTTFCTSSV